MKGRPAAVEGRPRKVAKKMFASLFILVAWVFGGLFLFTALMGRRDC
jgi:hypothetical protein